MAEGEHQDLLFKEGPLLKRQRGLNHRSLRNLKFQDRVCRLTSACLEYYEKRRLKGRFELERIRIVAEAGPFGRHQYCFQIGDEAEVMYFAAKSAEERDEWMKQFRQAAFGNGNKMLSHYHKGAYGLLINNRWSCCGSSQRMTSGCVPATGLHPLCHRSNSMVAAGVHGGHGHVKRKRTHLNAISENFNHRTLPRSYHPSSPSGSYDTTCSNTESPEDEAVSESCPPLPAGFSSVSNSPYNSRRVMRSTSYESIDTLLSEDSGRGLTLCSSWRSSQATLSSSAENLLSVVRPTQKKSQSEQSVSVNTQRAKAKQEASGISHLSIPADPQVPSVPVMQMHATPPLGSPSEDNEAKEEEEGGDKADPLSADNPQYPALFTAFFSDNYKAMKNILEQGADPDEAEPLESARSVLHHACAKGCVDIVELLLKHKANVNLRDGSGNLPLTEACKNGNMAIVEMLLASGAQVDLEGANGRTPLHEAANASHCDVIKVLISKQADPMLRDSSNDMPYDLAFKNDDKEVMEILQQSLPLNQRPYMFLGSHTLDVAREITTLTFRGLKDVLVSGSKDCRVHVWDAPSLTVTKEIPVPNTVLGVDMWMQYLAVGSTTVELFNMNDWDWKMVLTDHNQGNSRSENPPLHLLAFTPTGHLATASVESNTIKLWPPPHPGLTPGNELTPEASISVGNDQETGCICSLSASPNSQLPWMAVGFQPGKQFQPVGNKILYLINWMSRKVCYTIDTGRGGLAVGLIVTFSPDGRHLAIGCGSTLSIWETESGSELHKSDLENGTPISSLCYSPSDIHLAVGLSTGEVQVNGVNSNICIFSLGNLKNPSAATTMAYSKDGNLLGVGHADGTLQLWKVAKIKLEEERHLLTAVDEVMKKKGEVEQIIVQAMFIGPACNGKSSLMRRLVGQKPKEFVPSCSTGVAENVLQVSIKRPSALTAEVMSSSKVNVLPWSELSFDDEVVKLLMAISERLSKPQPSEIPPTQAEAQTASKLQSQMHSDTVPAVPIEPNTSAKDSNTHSLMKDTQIQLPILPSVVTSTTTNAPKFRTAKELFKDALKKGWSEAKKYIDGSCIMHLTDTGGQIEFQEMLSALASRPSLFFLVFRLDWELNTVFDIIYTHPDKGSLESYKSSIKLKDTLLQSLASIAAMGTYEIEHKELIPQQPKVFFIGTHKDKVSEEKIKEIDADLKEAVKSTAFYKEGLVQPAFASDDPKNMRMLLAVNNLSDDDADFECVRRAVERIINQDDFKVRAPPQWLIFNLVLRQAVSQPIISYEQCSELARQCGIHDSEELSKALLFLSTKVGLIRYFQNNASENLREIVIRDPKILFDKVTELVVQTFTFQNPKLNSQYVCDQFVKKGFFNLSDFQSLSKQDDLLTAPRLINLLKHMHIIAPIQNIGEDIKFFMPSILCHAEVASHPRSQTSLTPAVPPLLVCFHCGYCPKGIFPALVGYLLKNGMESNHKWIPQDKIYRDQFTFSVGPFPYTVSLIHTPFYIEVLCIPTGEESPHVPVLCSEVCTSISRGIRQVTWDLHYIGDANYYLAFDCPKYHLVSGRHGAEFRSEEMEGEPFCTLYCWQCEKPFSYLPSGYDNWFPQRTKQTHCVIKAGSQSCGEDDLVNIMGYLRVLDKTQLCRLGMVLGLSRLRVKVMMDTPTFLDDMIFSWMQQADNVATESGVPTWRSLVKALKHPLLQENGIASNIVKDKLLE